MTNVLGAVRSPEVCSSAAMWLQGWPTPRSLRFHKISETQRVPVYGFKPREKCGLRLAENAAADCSRKLAIKTDQSCSANMALQS